MLLNTCVFADFCSKERTSSQVYFCVKKILIGYSIAF